MTCSAEMRSCGVVSAAFVDPRSGQGRPYRGAAVCDLLMTMGSHHENAAEYWATKATGHSGPADQTDAIGEGLGAVALALLDVAKAIRELAEAQRES